MAAIAFSIRKFLTLTLLASVAPLVLYPTAASQQSTASDQPTSCSLPSASVVSPNYCNDQDDQIMRGQTKSCQFFLTMIEDAPRSECCTGLISIALNRTACICKLTFYPPTAYNATRQQDLPRICGLPTNLCGQCPMFIIPSANGGLLSTHENRVDETSTASIVGAISMAVICGVLLIIFVVFFILTLMKKRREKNSSHVLFHAPPPGGAF